MCGKSGHDRIPSAIPAPVLEAKLVQYERPAFLPLRSLHRLYQFHQNAMRGLRMHEGYAHSMSTRAGFFVDKFDPSLFQFRHSLVYVIYLKGYVVDTFAVVVQEFCDCRRSGSILQQLYRAISDRDERNGHALVILGVSSLKRQCTREELQSSI